MAVFNRQGFGVELVPVSKDEDSNIIVQLSNGAATYTYKNPDYGEIPASTNFDAAAVHGKTIPFIDPDKNIVLKAAIFLPSKLEKVTADVKEMVVVHEFIHAAGLDNKDHDTDSGVFYSPMEKFGGKLREWGKGENVKLMPPIRVGPQTLCAVRLLWVKNSKC